MCRFRFWYVAFVMYNATYHLLVLSVDRVIAILLPFKYRTLHHKTLARQTSLIVTMATMSTAVIPCFFVAYNPVVRFCGPQIGENFVLYFGLIVYVGIPSCTLFGSNIVFIAALLRRRHSKSKSVAQSVDLREALKQHSENNYVRMLMVIASSFLVLLLAGLILNFAAFRLSENEVTVELCQLIRDLAQLPLVFSHSVKFLFYWASGQLFRKAFSKAFPRIVCHRTSSHGLSGKKN